MTEDKRFVRGPQGRRPTRQDGVEMGRALFDAIGAQHHSAEDVGRLLDEAPPAHAVGVVLRAGDTAWNPTSTKTPISGPARVTYVRHADGGISVTVREP